MDKSNIDYYAIAGYNYALYRTSMPNFTDEMDLLAFDAGIRNANAKHDMNVKEILSTNCAYIEQSERVSDKELSVTWGNN